MHFNHLDGFWVMHVSFQHMVNFNFLHNSRWIIFPVQFCFFVVFFPSAGARLLHSLIIVRLCHDISYTYNTLVHYQFSLYYNWLSWHCFVLRFSAKVFASSLGLIMRDFVSLSLEIHSHVSFILFTFPCNCCSACQCCNYPKLIDSFFSFTCFFRSSLSLLGTFLPSFLDSKSVYVNSRM